MRAGSAWAGAEEAAATLDLPPAARFPRRSLVSDLQEDSLLNAAASSPKACRARLPVVSKPRRYLLSHV